MLANIFDLVSLKVESTMNFRIGLLAAACCVSLVGCASSIEQVRDTVSAAPDWYDERAAEVRGEGYPNVADIPTLSEEARTAVRELETGREELTRVEQLFRMDPRAASPGLELVEMQAWADEVKARFEIIAADPGDFLTDEDVAEAIAIFERARGRFQG